MSYPRMMMEQVKIVPGLEHEIGSGAGTADRVSLEGYAKAGILVQIYQGHNATTAITVDKHTAASGGTESTGITLSNWWKLEDFVNGTTADTWTKGTAAVSITSKATASVGSSSYYFIEIDADELRTVTSSVDYKFIEVETGISNALNFVWVTYFLFGPRYAGSTMPSAQA